MIREKEFRKIEFEVKDAVYEVLTTAKENEKDSNDFYLFLSNARYIENLKGSNTNPYVIEDRDDGVIDQHRIGFLKKYLGMYFSFDSIFNTVDSKDNIMMEMMIYTHIWESKNLLRMLKRLADLCNSKEYDWNPILIPEERSKYGFIDRSIRKIFNDKNLQISKVISKGYRSQLRNSFAHSDYSFCPNNEKINLHNYKPNSYEVESIKIDEWTNCFCYSFLLNLYLLHYLQEEKEKTCSPVNVFL